MNYNQLPENLPRPIDDGACDHLPGKQLPKVSLPSTSGGAVDLSALKKTSVLFVYPATGKPGVKLPEGWDDIPGARGCTPQACSYRDLSQEFGKLDVQIFGISIQSSAEQAEAAERLELAYPLLSDADFKLAKELALPTFEAEGRMYLKRVTLICEDARIVRCLYPVFPSNSDAQIALDFIKASRGA